MNKLEAAQSDLIFWTKKYEKVPSHYHRSEVINAKGRLQRAQWEHERKTIVRQ